MFPTVFADPDAGERDSSGGNPAGNSVSIQRGKQPRQAAQRHLLPGQRMQNQTRRLRPERQPGPLCGKELLVTVTPGEG